MKKIPSVYIHSMKTIYLSLSAKLAEGTIFKKILGTSILLLQKLFCFYISIEFSSQIKSLVFYTFSGHSTIIQ